MEGIDTLADLMRELSDVQREFRGAIAAHTRRWGGDLALIDAHETLCEIIEDYSPA
jgi:hypothetical protein